MIWENELLARGMMEYIRWLIFLGVWLFALDLFSKKYAVDELRNTRQILKERLISFIYIVFWCGLISIILSKGGPSCGSTDMYGCTEYSDEYREPWPKGKQLEYFIQIFGVVITAWIIAMKGYFIRKATK